MLRLLIVDDDALECEALEKHFRWNEMGIEVIGSCLNGLEALKRCKETKVDMVLSDIQMPIMSGLELNSCLHTILPNVKVVMMSAYDEFDYVRSAMNDGAFGYLLKPLKEEELVGMFGRCASQCRREIAHEQMFVQMKEEVSSLDAWKRDHLLHKLLLEDEADLPLSGAMKWLRCLDHQCALVYFRVTGDQSPNEETARMTQELQAQGITQTVGLRMSIHRGVLLCKGEIPAMLARLWEARMHFCIVRLSAPSSWSAMMREAESRFAQRFFTSKLQPASSNLLTDLEYAIDHNVFQNLDESLKLYFEHRAPASVEQGWAIAEKLMSRADDLMKERGWWRIVNFRQCIKQRTLLIRTRAEDALAERVLGYIKHHAALVQVLEAEEETDFVSDCIAKIQQQYASTISVEALAKELHVSANYLSTKFKLKAGMSISEYMACYRIYSAMRLLVTTEKSVADIALSCGFANVHYFHTTFKKYVFTTPKGYRGCFENVKDG